MSPGFNWNRAMLFKINDFPKFLYLVFSTGGWGDGEVIEERFSFPARRNGRVRRGRYSRLLTGRAKWDVTHFRRDVFGGAACGISLRSRRTGSIGEGGFGKLRLERVRCLLRVIAGTDWVRFRV